MLKRDELTNPNSCLNRSRDDEMLFVLLGRDKAAPVVIRAWVTERLRIGENQVDDPQILEALACARHMENARRIELAEKKSRGKLNVVESAEFNLLQATYFDYLDSGPCRKE